MAGETVFLPTQDPSAADWGMQKYPCPDFAAWQRLVPYITVLWLFCQEHTSIFGEPIDEASLCTEHTAAEVSELVRLVFTGTGFFILSRCLDQVKSEAFSHLAPTDLPRMSFASSQNGGYTVLTDKGPYGGIAAPFRPSALPKIRTLKPVLEEAGVTTAEEATTRSLWPGIQGRVLSHLSPSVRKQHPTIAFYKAWAFHKLSVVGVFSSTFCTSYASVDSEFSWLDKTAPGYLTLLHRTAAKHSLDVHIPDSLKGVQSFHFAVGLESYNSKGRENAKLLVSVRDGVNFLSGTPGRISYDSPLQLPNGMQKLPSSSKLIIFILFSLPTLDSLLRRIESECSKVRQLWLLKPTVGNQLPQNQAWCLVFGFIGEQDGEEAVMGTIAEGTSPNTSSQLTRFHAHIFATLWPVYDLLAAEKAKQEDEVKAFEDGKQKVMVGSGEGEGEMQQVEEKQE
ncbi:hypothetical protein JCM10213_001023 [Rhodosporidiobolus nylandii]